MVRKRYLFFQADTDDNKYFSKDMNILKFVREKSMDFIERAIMGDTEAVLFMSVLVCLWGIFLWDFYINYRQRKVIENNTHPTEELVSIISPDNYRRSRAYALDKNKFNNIHNWYSMLEMTIIITSNILKSLWTLAAQTTTPLSQTTHNIPIEEDLSEDHELRASIAFIIYATVFSFCDSLPWKLYNNFVIEKKHGINKQTMFYFIFDQVRVFFLSLAIIIPACYVLLYIIKWGGDNFYLYAWSFGFIIMTILMWIYPKFIVPLFDNYTPLPDGELKQSIQELCISLDFPLGKISITQNPKYSSMTNIYFHGLFTKHLVLFDTLVNYSKLTTSQNNPLLTGDQSLNQNHCAHSEILAIIAHDLGHWRLNHVIQNLMIGQFNLFLMLFIFGHLYNYGILYKTFGFKEIGTPNLIKMVIIFYFLFSAYNTLMEFLMNLFSRQNEFEADKFVVKLGKREELKSAIIKLNNQCLTYPLYDRWYSCCHNSTPSLLERLHELKK